MRINCMNCGAPLNDSAHCPRCGFDVVVQKKVYLLSNLYYNQGLEKAEIRDLSGAIDMLQRSLKFNKLNIQARNLLGLVYFETGEAVSKRMGDQQKYHAGGQHSVRIYRSSPE